jgi:hypothetical protein
MSRKDMKVDHKQRIKELWNCDTILKKLLWRKYFFFFIFIFLFRGGGAKWTKSIENVQK